MKIISNSSLESDGPLLSDSGLLIMIVICCDLSVAVLGFLFTYVGTGIFFIFDRDVHFAQKASIPQVNMSGWHLYTVVPATSNGDDLSDFVPTFDGYILDADAGSDHKRFEVVCRAVVICSGLFFQLALFESASSAFKRQCLSNEV